MIQELSEAGQSAQDVQLKLDQFASSLESCENSVTASKVQNPFFKFLTLTGKATKILSNKSRSGWLKPAVHFRFQFQRGGAGNCEPTLYNDKLFREGRPTHFVRAGIFIYPFPALIRATKN